MDTYSVPESAQNVSGNFAGSTSFLSARKHGRYLRINERLRQEKRVRGFDSQGNKVAVIRDGGLRIHAALYRIITAQKAASAVISTEVLADASDLALSTFAVQYRAMVQRGAILEHVDYKRVLHRICVDPDFPEFAQVEKRRLEAADDQAHADKLARAEQRHKRAARVNYAYPDQGEVRAEQDEGSPTEQDEGSLDDGQDCPDSKTTMPSEKNKVVAEKGQGCPSSPSERHESPMRGLTIFETKTYAKRFFRLFSSRNDPFLRKRRFFPSRGIGGY